MNRTLIVGLWLVCFGCVSPETSSECDCGVDEHCLAGRCLPVSSSDAGDGLKDAGLDEPKDGGSAVDRSDAGRADPPRLDSGMLDAGPPPRRDAGPPDAGPPPRRDAGPPDAGPPPRRDAGPPDAGPPPRRDAGPPDAGPPPPRDAGPPDAGPCPSSTLCGSTCVNTSVDLNHCGGCFQACGADETCFAGGCRCGSGPPCGRGTYCRAGACHALPVIVHEPLCIDFGRAHTSPDFLSRYTVYGRPGARVHKWNRHVSCRGAVASEAPETRTPTYISASGSVTFTIGNSAPILDCDHPNLGRYESWAVVDGHETAHVRTTSYNSRCSGIDTCSRAASFCPPGGS